MPAAAPNPADARRKAAREVIDILHEIATLLIVLTNRLHLPPFFPSLQNTHLDRQQLSYCVSLIENGVNPEALAKVILQLREEYPVNEDEEDEEEDENEEDGNTE